MSDDYYWTDTGTEYDATQHDKEFYSEHESGWSVHYHQETSPNPWGDLNYYIEDPYNRITQDGFTSMESAKDYVEMVLKNASDAESLCFLAWAEKTHPVYLNNLKEGYRGYKEASQ